MAKGKILVVDDEEHILELIRYNLDASGYEVIEASDGDDAVKKAINEVPDLILLDLMLPGKDGYDVCRELRSNGKTKAVPIIMLTAKSQDLDKIIGLELGSDDYITKPYSPKELILRVNNIVKRVYKDTNTNTIIYLNYKIDTDRRIVYDNDKEVKLTTLEFDLLLLFLTNKNKSFSRDEILNSVWGDDYFGSDRVVDDLVRRLRRKMDKLNISTVYGYGYRLS